MQVFNKVGDVKRTAFVALAKEHCGLFRVFSRGITESIPGHPVGTIEFHMR